MIEDYPKIVKCELQCDYRFKCTKSPCNKCIFGDHINHNGCFTYSKDRNVLVNILKREFLDKVKTKVMTDEMKNVANKIKSGIEVDL